MTSSAPLTFRPAGARDAETLERLAQLDSARPLRGEVVVAETAGRVVAAVSLDDGRAVSDPFVPTASVLHLLREAAEASRSVRWRRRRLRLRPGLAGSGW